MLQKNFQGFKIKGFSLLEVIIVVFLLAVISSYFIPKFTSIKYNTNISTLKSQLALIQNAIVNQKTKTILLSNSQELLVLDDAKNNIIGEVLFKNIIDFPIISTNDIKKEAGMWAKISHKSYIFYLSNNKEIRFSFENDEFLCKSEVELCREIQ